MATPTPGPVVNADHDNPSRLDVGMAILSVLLVGGFFVDLWAHSHGRVDESFFTPWHAILYAAAGLFGGILSNDKRRAIGMARRIRTGGVSINGATNTYQKPSGGFKHSGIGRENGRFGLEEYTELQVVMWPN